MKKENVLPLLLILIFFTIGYSTIAQEDKPKEYNTKKFQISIGVSDIFAKNYWWYSSWYIDEYGSFFFPYPDGDYYRQPSLILGFKCHGKKGAFRVGVNSRYSNSTHEDMDTIGTTYTFNNFGTTLNLGYEWHLTFERVLVYYGFDASFSHTSFGVKSELVGSPVVRTEEVKIYESAFGISPLIGINYFITPRLSIGTEVKFTAEYMTGKHKYEQTNTNFYPPNYKEEEQKRSGFRTYFGPLGFLSINIHL